MVLETEQRSRSNRLVVMRRTKQSLGYHCNREPKIRTNRRQVNVMLWKREMRVHDERLRKRTVRKRCGINGRTTVNPVNSKSDNKSDKKAITKNQYKMVGCI